MCAGTGMRSETSVVGKGMRMLVEVGLLSLEFCLGLATIVKCKLLRTSVHFSFLFSLGHFTCGNIWGKFTT